MSTHHHSVGRACPDGARLVVRLYPRSILWVLLAVALILMLQGNWATTGLIAVLVAVVIWQTIRTDHLDRLRARRRRRR